MKPILFDSTATTFASYGLGVLTDAKSCECKMQGSQYELTMEYPIDGSHYGDIAERKIILAKPCQTDNPQPFRIYRISKAIKGIVTVYARHISYDLTGIPVLPFTASSASDFATKIAANVAVTCPFSFSTNVSKSETLKVDHPVTAREILSENDPSWASVYGGELVFDGYSVQLKSAAGANRGVVIRYGVDLVTADMEENISSVYTGILPYYWDASNEVLYVGDILNGSGTYSYERILPVDLTEYITEEEASKAKVEEVGAIWLAENSIGIPSISLRLSYAQINQTVRLFDTITVKIERLGIDVQAKVTSTTYDVLKERYASVNVGDARETFAADIYDASRLKTGLLDLKRIKERSIGGGKMASGAVGSRILADWSVIRQKLANGAVDDDQLSADVKGYFAGTRKFAGLWTGDIVANGTIRSTQSAILLGNKRVYVTADNRILVEETQ